MRSSETPSKVLPYILARFDLVEAELWYLMQAPAGTGFKNTPLCSNQAIPVKNVKSASKKADKTCHFNLRISIIQSAMLSGVEHSAAAKKLRARHAAVHVGACIASSSPGKNFHVSRRDLSSQCYCDDVLIVLDSQLLNPERAWVRIAWRRPLQ